MSLTFTGGTSSASASQADKVLRIGLGTLPGNLDPAAVADDASATVVKGMFEGLVRLNQAGLAVPGIAKSWMVSSDGRTYTFTLRGDAKWSNKQQVLASDFEYAWKRALAPEAGNVYAFNMYAINNAEQYHQGILKDASQIGVKALNNTTLQVTLKEKTAYFLQLLAESIYLPVNQKAVKANRNWAAGMTSMVNNGPFKLKQRTAEAITLVKNPDYYAAKDIKLSEVHLQLPKLGTANPTAAFVNKEVDWVGGGGEEQLDYSIMNYGTSRLVYGAPYATNYYYMFNLNQAPFSNLKIRKALAMALDREQLYGNPAYGVIPPAIHGVKGSFRSEVADQAYFTMDIAAAKQLLAEGLREEGLSKLPSFSIIMNEGEGHENIAKRVVTAWNRNLGIEATIELQNWTLLLENRRNQNFMMARAGWSADFNDPASMLEPFTSWSADNDTGWSNSQYDGYIKQAKQTADPAQRMQLYAKAEKMLIDQMIILPLYYCVADVAHNPLLKNVYIDYDGSIAFARGSWL
ncbi:peptide ABC transporter substrate-binding protein [Paenibacillus sp. MMS20-IR301]|uniref:peptide ABC transporter substrate-binding protein n=1 Tax=Paenibacillus sp. MMS20-IR301 TaxID=2895946 RepID=UPI0028F1754E|nr:peptide ABC transporter substrate-binding protein [Paenibacillus sp. MMS20-IR301]WNS45354.1 peptide ABC transporter substrate-binding protein [Paenibacillus sp. MMS20-IR301]